MTRSVAVDDGSPPPEHMEELAGVRDDCLHGVVGAVQSVSRSNSCKIVVPDRDRIEVMGPCVTIVVVGICCRQPFTPEGIIRKILDNPYSWQILRPNTRQKNASRCRFARFDRTRHVASRKGPGSLGVGAR